MFESKFLSTTEEIQKFESLKAKFFRTKTAVEVSLKNASKVNPFTGEKLSDSQIAELSRKMNIINEIETLLVPEYGKFQDFKFYFNNGCFRSDEEINLYRKMKIEQDWSVCDRFNKHVVIQLFLFGALIAFFMIMPLILVGRQAIFLYIFPVWPLFVIGVGISLYRFAKKKLLQEKKYKNHRTEKEVQNNFISGTTVNFMQKFY